MTLAYRCGDLRMLTALCSDGGVAESTPGASTGIVIGATSAHPCRRYVRTTWMSATVVATQGRAKHRRNAFPEPRPRPRKTSRNSPITSCAMTAASKPTVFTIPRYLRSQRRCPSDRAGCRFWRDRSRRRSSSSPPRMPRRRRPGHRQTHGLPGRQRQPHVPRCPRTGQRIPAKPAWTAIGTHRGQRMRLSPGKPLVRRRRGCWQRQGTVGRPLPSTGTLTARRPRSSCRRARGGPSVPAAFRASAMRRRSSPNDALGHARLPEGHARSPRPRRSTAATPRGPPHPSPWRWRRTSSPTR